MWDQAPFVIAEIKQKRAKKGIVWCLGPKQKTEAAISCEITMSDETCTLHRSQQEFLNKNNVYNNEIYVKYS